MPPVRQPMTLKQLEAASPGSRVNITLVVTNVPRTQILSSNFLEPDEAEPFNAFHRTERAIEIEWTSSTKIVMGVENEIVKGALLRVVGVLDENRLVHADQLVILTRVARVL